MGEFHRGLSAIVEASRMGRVRMMQPYSNFSPAGPQLVDTPNLARVTPYL